jgi:hypothetical protein
MALLYFTKVTTCSAIADALDSVSHDRLTRMLQGSWSGHLLLDLALRTLCSVVGGSLIVDDTVVAQPYARLLGEAAWVWANKDRKVLFGVSVLLLVWTDGQRRIPLALRVWHTGGVSKYDWALARLSEARNRLKCNPQFVLCDSWSPSKKLLKRIRDYGWYFVCQLKKHRVFEGQALRCDKQQPSWHAVGSLTGGAERLCGEIPPQVLRHPPTDRNRPRGAHAIPETARGRRSDQRMAEPTEPGGLSRRLHALLEGNASPPSR